MIKFNEFFDKVLALLKQEFGVIDPGSHVMLNTNLLNGILEGYQEGVKEGDIDLYHTRGVFCRVDWDRYVRSTAQRLKNEMQFL